MPHAYEVNVESSALGMISDLRLKNGSVQHFKSTSSDEHISSVIAQQGYDSMFIDNMLLEYHGI